MTTGFIVTLITQAVGMVLLLSAPMLVVSLIVGFTIALLQTITSIQEQTLSFVPKALAVLLVLVLVTPWILSTAVSFLRQLFSQIPAIAN
ncbi:MAG: flagellar biosynthesis protein FliQ [Candidatus Sericytochromatia bacterium]|nr:flagellar biosynthesis protein FliQ [Candidatus Sericytochromatia bacterium]